MACTTVPVPPDVPTVVSPTRLQIGVASSAVGYEALVAEPYGAERPFTHLEFTHANSTALLTKLNEGSLDAAFLHVIPENNRLWFNPVALDGLAIIVHPENSVRELSLAQVQGVFNGRLQQWSALGGADVPIELVSREFGSGARVLLQQRVLAEQPLHINALVQTSQDGLVAAVARNLNGIGYGLMGALPDDVVAVAINGRLPTPNEVGTQNYALTTPLYFVTSDTTEPEGELRHFLAWLQSPTGQAVISERYGRVR